jgi:pectin lyase
MHVYNNYYEAFGVEDNNRDTSGIIGGDGSEIVSQNNMFNGYTKGQALMMGGDDINPCRDDNSFISNELNETPEEINFEPKKISEWYPNATNYGYSLLDTINTNNLDTKSFCMKYAGCFNSKNDIKYITDEDLSNWPSIKYDSPFLVHIDLPETEKGFSRSVVFNIYLYILLYLFVFLS